MSSEKSGPEQVAALLKDAKITSTERDRIIASLYYKDNVLTSLYVEPLVNSMTVKEFDDFLQKAGAKFRLLSVPWYDWIYDPTEKKCVKYSGGACYE